MSFLPSMPDASLLDVFKAYPEFTKPLHEFAQRLMRGPSPFSEGERELIAAYVSSLNGCDFCRSSHTAVAVRFGVPEELIADLSQDINRATVSAKLKPVLHYVQKLNERPAHINQADVDAVYEAGWNETALCHAALVCAFFNFMNRWVDGFGLATNPQTVQMAGEHLYQKGYQGILELLEQTP